MTKKEAIELLRELQDLNKKDSQDFKNKDLEDFFVGKIQAYGQAIQVTKMIEIGRQ